MKKLITFIVAALFLGTGSVYAEANYFGIGTGLQFNLGSLGETIASSGLDSSQLNRANTGYGVAGVLKGQTCTGACLQATGTPQKAIIPENQLIVMERSTNQAVRAYTSGPMTGLLLDLFYEHQGDGTFYRVGVQYVKKIAGGDTQSTILNMKWYDIEWDYYAWHIPLYYGVNVNVSDTGSVYAGAGINYSQGGWNLGGSNLGDIPTAILGVPTGLHTATDSTGKLVSTGAYKEAAKFRVKGFGFNYLIGVDKKLASGAKIYFEIETIVNGAQGQTVTKSTGGQAALKPVTAYPINLSGTKYKFGYKMPI